MLKKNSFLNKIKLQQFLYLRAQIGHNQKTLDKTMNSFVIGIQQNTAVLNSFYILWSWEKISQLLIRIFLYRQKFMLLATNKMIPDTWLKSLLEWKFQTSTKTLTSYLGYIGSNWNGGIFSNWSTLWSFTLLAFKDLLKNKALSKTRYQLLKKLNGRMFKGNHPTFPDFLIGFNVERLLLKEANLLKIISISLVDSDKDLRYSSLKVFGNDESFLLLEFFLHIIDESFLVSSREEQELFYRLIFKELKSLF